MVTVTLIAEPEYLSDDPSVIVSALDGVQGNPPSNDAAFEVSFQVPYTATVTIEGTAPILFHRWSVEAIAEKAAAAKNSRVKKTDNVESYVYRLPGENGKLGHLALPGEYFRRSIINSARYRQDPRSPRKSAMEMFTAGVQPLTDLADLGTPNWDFIHQARVMVQRSGVTRERPALQKGWRAEFELSVLTPEYISPQFLLDVIVQAGRLIGIADFRPTYGRYQVVSFKHDYQGS